MIVVDMKLNKESLKKLKKEPKAARAKLLIAARGALFIAFKYLRLSVTQNLKSSRAKGYKYKSGHLAQSLTTSAVKWSGKNIKGSIGSNLPYARIHEEGGVIRPKTKQALTVPFPGKVYPPASILKGSGKTFVRKNVIFMKIGSDDVIPIYALEKEVVIPARKWITKGERKATPRIIELFKNTEL